MPGVRTRRVPTRYDRRGPGRRVSRAAGHYPATPDAVALARRAACAFAAKAGAAENVLKRLALAVSEAVTNAVLHAYRDAADDATVELVLEVNDDELVVLVRDRGHGLSPRFDSPGLGVGIPLMGRIADAIELRSLEVGGTEVSMRFSLRGSDAAA
jgi:serine/threonine-protein kinase RsbW